MVIPATPAFIDDLALLEEIEESVQLADPMKFGDSYWRRTDGWITHAHADAHNIINYKAKGMVPIERYGKFFVTPTLKNDKFKRIIPVQDIFRRPWEVILRGGGAFEFPLDQIIAHNWHRDCFYVWWDELPDKTFNKRTVHLVKDGIRYKDPATGYRAFPQLDGFETQDFPCLTCGIVFNYKEHLHGHQMISHREDMQIETTRETVRIISEGLKQGGDSTGMASAIGQLAQIMSGMQVILEAIMETRAPGFTPPSEIVVIPPVAEGEMYEEVTQVQAEDTVNDETKVADGDQWDIPPGHVS